MSSYSNLEPWELPGAPGEPQATREDHMRKIVAAKEPRPSASGAVREALERRIDRDWLSAILHSFHKTKARPEDVRECLYRITSHFSALIAQPSQADVGGWQPIETAPKDGTRILIWFVHANAKYSKDSIGEGWEAAHEAEWIDHNGGGWTWHGLCGVATYWQPLPAPPSLIASPPGMVQSSDGGTEGYDGSTFCDEALIKRVTEIADGLYKQGDEDDAAFISAAVSALHNAYMSKPGPSDPAPGPDVSVAPVGTEASLLRAIWDDLEFAAVEAPTEDYVSSDIKPQTLKRLASYLASREWKDRAYEIHGQPDVDIPSDDRIAAIFAFAIRGRCASELADALAPSLPVAVGPDVREALMSACVRLQSFLDTFGDLGDSVTQADINDWIDLSALPSDGGVVADTLSNETATEVMAHPSPMGSRSCDEKTIACGVAGVAPGPSDDVRKEGGGETAAESYSRTGQPLFVTAAEREEYERSIGYVRPATPPSVTGAAAAAGETAGGAE